MSISCAFRRTKPAIWINPSLGRFSADPRPGGGAHFPLDNLGAGRRPDGAARLRCYADPMIEIAAVLLVIATSVAMLMLLGEH